jgi:hypothetical protein
VKQLLQGSGEEESNENTGFFSRLFGGGSQKCKGTEGLISEGEKMMGEDMSPEAMDAAIIASAQKIEHYEISGYGTARAFARELRLTEVADLLTQTLNEEYQADDQLTQLAVGKLNIEAEYAVGVENGNGSGMSKQRSSGNGTHVKRSPANGTSRMTNNKKATTSNTASSKKSNSSPAKRAGDRSKTVAAKKSVSNRSKTSKPGSSNKPTSPKRSSGVRSVMVKSVSKASTRSGSSKKASPAGRKNSNTKKTKTSGRR